MIPSVIIAVFMILMIVAGVVMSLNYSLLIFREVRRMSVSLAKSDKLRILNGFLINETTVGIELTATDETVAPLTSVQFIVCYENLEGRATTYLLKYSVGDGPGWDLITLYSGKIQRSLEGSNYLIPGEVAVVRLRLPTPKSENSSIIVIAVSPGGVKSGWAIGDA